MRQLLTGRLSADRRHRPPDRHPLRRRGPLDSGRATGLAVDPASDDLYVAHRDRVSVYDSGGATCSTIGLGSLGDGYGVAVSAAGEVYVADASTETVKVYDPADSANFPGDPSAVIDGPSRRPAASSSLRDAALAVDRLKRRALRARRHPARATPSSRGRGSTSSTPAGAYLGHLKNDVVDGAPSGIAVDNSARHPGRVYVTSGNTHLGGVYAYGAGAATTAAPRAPTIPPAPLGGGRSFPRADRLRRAAAGRDRLRGRRLPGAAPDAGRPDPDHAACRASATPSPTTSATGTAPRSTRKRQATTHARRASTSASAAPARGAGGRRGPQARLRRAVNRAGAARRRARCERGGRPGATGARRRRPTAQGLLPGAAGFDAAAYADGGAAATQAGSHPYSLDFTVGLDQSGGEADLRDLRIELPPGLLLNPAFSATLCSDADFGTPRILPLSSPASRGRAAPTAPRSARSRCKAAPAATRRFGLFELEPGRRLRLPPRRRPLRAAARLRRPDRLRRRRAPTSTSQADRRPAGPSGHRPRAGPLGRPLGRLPQRRARQLPKRGRARLPLVQMLGRRAAQHSPARAFLTLPTECRDPLSFTADVGSWQEAGEQSATAVNRDSGGDPAPIAGCSSLAFNPDPEGFLSVKKASSSSGYAFGFTDDDPGLADPRARIHALTRKAVVALPEGVTLNPSLGAGPRDLHPGPARRRDRLQPARAGCPNGAKIGDFSVRVPFYDGLLTGGIYLAKPDEPGGAPGAENPFDSLLAVYLVAKSADRGVLIKRPGQARPRPDRRHPHRDLRRPAPAPLHRPARSTSAPASGRPWSARRPAAAATTTDHADALGGRARRPRPPTPTRRSTPGIDFGPCPDGSTPPFAPGAVAGGVNSNVGSYTPYFVHLSRKDTEQEITSYSLVLPKGITGKLAGIPFCPEAAIAAARAQRAASMRPPTPPVPAASQVGRTLTGYGVGPALTYAPGRIYLAGPYHGAPLSLVTINSATVGPFDLGTIVIRSAFAGRPPHRPAADRLRRLGPDPPHHRRHPAAPARRPHLHGPLPVHPQPLQL